MSDRMCVIVGIGIVALWGAASFSARFLFHRPLPLVFSMTIGFVFCYGGALIATAPLRRQQRRIREQIRQLRRSM